MIIIGEKLNSSVKSAFEAYSSETDNGISAIIDAQVAGNADYLDINTSLCKDETGTMDRVIGLIPDGVGLMIDSTDSEVLKYQIERLKGKKVFINSVTPFDRLDIIPFIANTDIKVVALPITREEATPENRLKSADELFEKLTNAGVKKDNIYFDILVSSVAVGDKNAVYALETLKLFKARGYKTVGGLSNVSFGLPERKDINYSFISMCELSGLDAAIVDASSPTVKKAIRSSELLLGLDEYCMNYISAVRDEE